MCVIKRAGTNPNQEKTLICQVISEYLKRNSEYSIASFCFQTFSTDLPSQSQTQSVFAFSSKII